MPQIKQGKYKKMRHHLPMVGFMPEPLRGESRLGDTGLS